MNPTPHILYLASVLPKRSETFVYREVLGLRDRGTRVSVATVHPPEQNLGDPRLDALAEESRSLQIYGRGIRGKLAVYNDSARQSLWRPTRGIFETPARYWLKYGFQCEAGYALARRLKVQERDGKLPGGITHIHAHMAHVPTTIAMHAAEALGIPFSFTGHAADLFRDRSALKTKLRRAAFVSCISHWHRAFYQDVTPLPDRRLPVIRCGVDLNEFSPAPQPPPASAGVAPKLLAVGRLVPKKGFDILIRAIAQTRHHPAPTLTLVGDGPEEFGLRDLAEKFDVADRVIFTGAKDNREVRDLMGDATLFVLPCRSAADGDRDGIPVVLMEAMARNVCVVSGDLATIRELVIDNETGRLVTPPPAGDPAQLAATIDHLLAEPDNRHRLADAGRAHVATEFSMSTNLDRLEKAFYSTGGTD